MKTYPGIVHSSIHTQTVRTLVPQNICMNIKRGVTHGIDAIEWHTDIEGGDTTTALTALLDLEACAREALRIEPQGGHDRLMPYRIIGTLPHHEFNQPDLSCYPYSRWLNSTFVYVDQSILPVSQKPIHQEDMKHNSAVYGCHYSSSWQAASCERDTVREDLTHETPCKDLHILCDGTDREECAREIFGIFVLTLASLLKPLRECDLYEEVVYNGSSASVARHRVVDRVVELMIQKGPSLFPTKKTAREMIIPAFIKHNLLPTPKRGTETPSSGTSQVAS